MIVIDPGHGGTTHVGNSSPNNATGPHGALEKTLTLDLGRRVRTALSLQGLDALLTRETDINLGLRQRAEIARAHHATAFVSIHFNAFSNPATQGTETWVHTTSSDASRRLATSIQQPLVATTGYPDRGVKVNNFGVLSPLFHDPVTASCLVEVSFLTNPADEARLRDESYRDRLGAAIAGGIAAHHVVVPPRLPIEADLSMVVGATADAPRTALMVAAANGHADVVQLLIDAGAAVNARTANGWTALMFAAAAGHEDVVALLLEARAEME
jgi:N-acetylmuramoyl-L-alanine amidase/Ankyrin repeats (3 copies)